MAVSLLKGRRGQRIIKYFQTVHLLMVGTTLGLVLVLVGPTLMDLADVLQVSIANMTYISFGGEFGAFFGSALALVIFKYCSAQKVIIMFTLLIGISNILIPHGGTPIITSLLTFCSGCGVGIVEIGGYVWLVAMWRDNVSPIIQLIHLTYGIGAFISPLIAEPFLNHHEFDLEVEKDLNQSAADQNTTYDEHILDNSTELFNLTSAGQGFTTSMVYIPYALVGSYALLNASLMIISYFMDSKDVRPEQDSDGDEELAPTSKTFQYTLVILIGLYTLISVILEVTVGKFLPIYTVKQYGLSRSHGAYVVSLFYGGFTFGRIAAVPISMKLSPMQMMNVGQTFLVTSAAVLTYFNTDETILWVCAFTLGAGLSPLFGSSTAWLAKHVTLSHDFMSIIMTMVTFGALFPPLLVGTYIETHNYVLMLLTIVASCGMAVTCWLMHLTASVHKHVYNHIPLGEELTKTTEESE